MQFAWQVYVVEAIQEKGNLPPPIKNKAVLQIIHLVASLFTVHTMQFGWQVFAVFEEQLVGGEVFASIY